MDSKRLSFLGGAVLAAHNLEEALAAPAWLRGHLEVLPSPFRSSLPRMADGAFYAVLALVTVLSLAWIAATFRSPPRSVPAYSLLVLFGMYFFNALVPHVAGALLLRSYVPGLATALFAVIPFSVLFVADDLRTGRHTACGSAFAGIAALALYLCIGVAAQWALRTAAAPG